MLDTIFDPAIIASFLSLAALEIVLGIDNVVFLSLIISRLPPEQRKRARQIGLGLALGMRIIMLLGITWIMQLTTPILSIYDYDLSWRDLILLSGGLFLLAKGTHEIHRGIEGEEGEDGNGAAAMSSFTSVIIQVVLIDLVFSIDSIITAVGIADVVGVMIAAVMVAIAVMYFASETVSHFIEHHPTTKMLALSFLLLIGVALVADGLHFHIPRGYIYFAMAFAAFVEIFNVISQRRRKKARAAHK
ncbi:MAG: TerC family protein [Hyphomicrobiaceae bacterium]